MVTMRVVGIQKERGDRRGWGLRGVANQTTCLLPQLSSLPAQTSVGSRTSVSRSVGGHSALSMCQPQLRRVFPPALPWRRHLLSQQQLQQQRQRRHPHPLQQPHPQHLPQIQQQHPPWRRHSLPRCHRATGAPTLCKCVASCFNSLNRRKASFRVTQTLKLSAQRRVSRPFALNFQQSRPRNLQRRHRQRQPLLRLRCLLRRPREPPQRKHQLMRQPWRPLHHPRRCQPWRQHLYPRLRPLWRRQRNNRQWRRVHRRQRSPPSFPPRLHRRQPLHWSSHCCFLT
jgi:hypothetical protein